MLTIFDHINAALFTKDKSIIENSEEENALSPFMLNRWISMYSSDLANIVNTTSNKYITKMSKREFFDFITAVFPKVKFKRITYIKKTASKSKTDKDEEEQENNTRIARILECSTREIEEMKAMVDFLK